MVIFHKFSTSKVKKRMFYHKFLVSSEEKIIKNFKKKK